MYLRNAAMPSANAQLQFKAGSHVFGAVFDNKTLKPSLVNTLGKQADATINSTSFMGYAKLVFDKLTIKGEFTMGQNLFDHLQIGGYAVASVDKDGEYEYTNFNVTSAWGEISYGKDIEYGVFFGMTANNGADDEILTDNVNVPVGLYARGISADETSMTSLKSVMRVSPRIKYTSGKFRIAGELEYTQASYGKVDFSDKGNVSDDEAVANIRALIAFYIFF
jgi:hypothetical protein